MKRDRVVINTTLDSQTVAHLAPASVTVICLSGLESILIDDGVGGLEI